MKVRILFFASLRECSGHKALDYEIETGTTAGGLLQRLRTDIPGMAASGRISLAVNEEYVEPEHELSDGDEIALIPPVSGGRESGVE